MASIDFVEYIKIFYHCRESNLGTDRAVPAHMSNIGILYCAEPLTSDGNVPSCVAAEEHLFLAINDPRSAAPLSEVQSRQSFSFLWSTSRRCQ
jgi:hypothetical protein